MNKSLAVLLVAGMLSSCHRPTSPSNTDQQQGNPQARPEKSATAESGSQKPDDQAGKNAHTGRPDGAKRQ
ncbi:MAG: hypothetical protein JO108_24440 [Acidobacteriaceae bacterium]|nr:hypothetical protein [Acidobacteriaceae bacterium]